MSNLRPRNACGDVTNDAALDRGGRVKEKTAQGAPGAIFSNGLATWLSPFSNTGGLREALTLTALR